MKTARSLLSLLTVIGILGISTLALSQAAGLIEGKFLSKVQTPGASYCHLRFPAISQDTLFTDAPELQDANTKDIVDFYGSCDHDPLGKDEVRRQRQQYYEYRFDGDND